MRSILLAASAALIAVVGSAVLLLDQGPAADAQSTVNVAIGDNWFCNSSFAGGTCDTNITAGDTVLWTNSGRTRTRLPSAATPCAPCRRRVGSILAPSTTAGRSPHFPTAGTYEYYCAIHGN